MDLSSNHLLLFIMVYYSYSITYSYVQLLQYAWAGTLRDAPAIRMLMSRPHSRQLQAHHNNCC